MKVTITSGEYHFFGQFIVEGQVFGTNLAVAESVALLLVKSSVKY